MKSLNPCLGYRHFRLGVYVIYVIIFASIIPTDMLSVMCGKCLNHSSCRIITHLKSNVTTVQCACLQGWLGANCQAFVKLRIVTITLTTVTLNLEVMSPGSGNYSESHILYNFTSDAIDFETLSHPRTSIVQNRENQTAFLIKPFTVEYWTSSKTGVCNIVPNVTRTNLTIMGLEPGTRYTFCAKTDKSPVCDFRLVRNHGSDVPYCVNVSTKPDNSKVPLIYVILASCIALSGLIALCIVIVIAKRNGYISMMLCDKEQKKVNKKRQMHWSSGMTSYMTPSSSFTPSPTFENSDQDVLLLKSSRNDQTISISTPQGPGKPKYQVSHKQMRGYASFTAKNEQTIPLSTVLEYGGAEDQDCYYDDEDGDDADNHVRNTEIEIHADLEAD